MNYSTILVDSSNGVGTIRLNRPDVLNALDKATGRELLEAFEQMREDESVRVVVLTGAGRAFSAGGDIKEMAESGGGRTEDFYAELLSTLNRMVLTLYEMPKPVIAAINGTAAGLGFNLALGADLRIAARSAEFSQAFLKIGLVPDGGGTFLLPRIVGWAKATELILTARTVSSEEALSLGLVTEVVDDSIFEETVKRWADRFAKAPTGAIGRVKQLLVHSLTADYASQLEKERELQLLSGRTNDFCEGITAFAERRAPKFTGT